MVVLRGTIKKYAEGSIAKSWWHFSLFADGTVIKKICG
jgi:hypothetical protein